LQKRVTHSREVLKGEGLTLEEYQATSATFKPSIDKGWEYKFQRPVNVKLKRKRDQDFPAITPNHPQSFIIPRKLSIKEMAILLDIEYDLMKANKSYLDDPTPSALQKLKLLTTEKNDF
jgi:hypothetical protein